MIVAWMVLGLVVSALIAGAASVAESGLRRLHVPLRAIWCVAMGLAVALLAASPIRWEARFQATLTALAGSTPTAAAVCTRCESYYAKPMSALDTPEAILLAKPGRDNAPADPAANPLLPRRVDTREDDVDSDWGVLSRAATAVMRPMPVRVEQAAAMLWLLSSLAMAGLVAFVADRYARAREDWDEIEIDGMYARVAPAAGPAVLGLFAADIVVPRWLAHRSLEEQRLVVAHEGEHLLARDHLLLAGAWAAIVIMPWNVVLWRMASRLRLAIELDCDRRVLQRGVSANTYGLLLIDLATEYRGLGLGVTPFAGRPSQLEQRLRAMTPSADRLARARAAVATLVASAAVVAAVNVQVPQTAVVDPPPAAPRDSRYGRWSFGSAVGEARSTDQPNTRKTTGSGCGDDALGFDPASAGTLEDRSGQASSDGVLARPRCSDARSR